jgi:aspartate/tyrosine/aromatic aminotransferase
MMRRQAVRKAEARVVACGESKEYLGIEGLPAFVEAAAKFALGPSSAALAEGRVASVQTLSGTGSLRVCADTLREVGGASEVFLPSPSWGNHAKIFAAGGLKVHIHTTSYQLSLCRAPLYSAQRSRRCAKMAWPR